MARHDGGRGPLRGSRARALPVFVLLALVACDDDNGEESADFMVDGEVALGAVMSLGDGRLQGIADHFEMLAQTEDARSGDWERIREPLGAAGALLDQALLWFALPDGSYWSVQQGQAGGNLTQRAYWPGLMAGETVLGDMVVSLQTGRATAIVAVPVSGAEGAIVGALGASVYLDVLGGFIDDVLGLDENEIFYSFDEQPLVGLNKDPELVFLDPAELGEPEIEQAFQEMLAGDAGVVEYTFNDRRRTVHYRRSPVSGWWYAFGVVWEN